MKTNPQIAAFWQHLQQFKIPSLYLRVIADVLAVLASEPLTSSVAVPGGRIITKTPKRGHTPYTRLACVPLWQHAIDTAIALTELIPPWSRHGSDFGIEIITALGHDLGKLMAYRPGPYVSALHAAVSAEVLCGIIGGRLCEFEVLLAVEVVSMHHGTMRQLAEENGIAFRLAKADKIAREREVQGRIGIEYGLEWQSSTGGTKP